MLVLFYLLLACYLKSGSVRHFMKNHILLDSTVELTNVLDFHFLNFINISVKLFDHGHFFIKKFETI